MTLKIPDRYKPTGKKFAGGMGEVLICDDQNLDRKVAIKMVLDVSDVKRLLDEIAALQEIRSKHVVEIYDLVYGTRADEIAIVEAYLPGIDLFSTAVFTQLNSYLKALYQIASGIDDIHAHGRIHRDIKPNNMKFDEENLLKIFDFGLSRLFGTKATTMGFRGTLGFAAPELFKPGKVVFTEAVDTYAFGATAWYLATHKFPRDFVAIPPKLPVLGMKFGSLSVALPSDLADLLDFCLDRDPANRPKMSDLRSLISKHLLTGAHRALVVSAGRPYDFHGPGQKVSIAAKGLGKLTIEYDGLNFKATEVEGEVFVNYAPINAEHIFLGSCVIALGRPELGARRIYVTFDVSHPEVVL